MFTFIDKAIVAILPPLLLWANQKWGLKFDTSPETLTAIAGFLSSILVYFVPNKAT